MSENEMLRYHASGYPRYSMNCEVLAEYVMTNFGNIAIRDRKSVV